MADVVGRGAELEAGDAFLERAARGPATLVLEGEAGIGKSTVWSELMRRAESRGYLVLAARPARAESSLSLSGISDLLEPVGSAAFEALPEPQRQALEAALLRAEPSDRPPEGRVLGTAIRTLLELLAATRPVIVAIDDVQWLDVASATALGFALRRIRDVPVSLLAARRSREPIAPALVEGRSTATEALVVGPLSVAALHHVVKQRLGRTPSRPTLIRIHQASGGNAFFALEIVRLLAEVGEPAAGEPLPVPDDVRELLRRRVRRLPAGTREVLLVAATLGVPRVALIATALGRDVDADIEIAEREAMTRTTDGVVAFLHPLLGAAIYREATPEQRRDVHARLAATMPGTEEGARHGALASPGPDEAVAAALEEAAGVLDARAAPAAAADLADLAIRLTPPDNRAAIARRATALGRYAIRGGDPQRAVAALEGVLRTAETALERARTRLLLVPIRYDHEGTEVALALCEAVIREEIDDPRLLAEAHGFMTVMIVDDDRSDEHLRLALAYLAQIPDPEPQLLSLILGRAILGEASKSGRAPAPDDIERLLALERQAPRPSVSDRFSASLGAVLKYIDEFDGARHWLEATYQAALDEGDEGSLPYALSHLPQLELWTGDWPKAEAYAERGLAISVDLGLEAQRRQALYNLALVHVHQGRVDEARAELAGVLKDAEADDDIWTIAVTLPALGFLELSLGDAATAARHFRRATEARDSTGDSRPRRHEADLVESLIETGALDDAAAFQARFEARARAHEMHSALANLATSRARLRAAHGDLDAAIEALEEALAEHDLVDIPFDRARTLLAIGQVRRRRRERRAAREALEAAEAIFERLGAPIWAARARDELERLGLRRSNRDELTESERRVVELAASGQTNRQVADALFLSPKTVEAHLARAYGKLGIASRAELGAVMAQLRSEPPTS
ncbi:MAG TPA: AAA family ATPase [Candidatus Limnocylindrales bacterium]|nr:AAA family ATPase [Candidatus Limnocylindrales bacterium]